MPEPTLYLQRDQPPGVPPLALTGERTLPDVPEENYWFQRHLVVYEWIARQVGGLRVADLACGEGYGSDVLRKGGAAAVVGVDANPEAHEHARLRYVRDGLTFTRTLVELYDEPCDAVVFLQTIEHVRNPGEILDRFRKLVGPGGVAFVSTPNVLTLAPAGADRSGNPWHVHEYRPEEFAALCRAHFASVELYGLFHARKLAIHAAALKAGLGSGARGARHHEALLRPLHARDRRARLRATARAGARAWRRAGPRRGAARLMRAPGEGELAIVLHSHMPYIERFGTWPFGEEWLWEAIATSYLPVLELLDAGAALTLSMTPVLCDQLEAPGALHRCREFLATIRVESHARDIASATDPGEVEALKHSAAQYERARERLERLDLLGALGRHVAWTSSATHAILPLLATDAGVRLQLRAGIDAHRRRFGGWGGGLWLPECAYAPWLDGLLEEAGVRAVCVDLTDVLDARAHLRPLRTAAGPLLVPIDRATIELVWSRGGYPAGAAYRNYHHFTPHRHRARANDGAPYDPARAAGAARRDAADFVARTRERVAGGGLAVCALDTELIGDWWHEGPLWLAAVIDEAARQGLALTRLDEALARHGAEPAPPHLPVTSWGTPRDLSTWSAPPVAGMAWSARDAELRTVAAGDADERAVRELLALQSSDWAFLVARDLAEPYGRERADGHRAQLDAALAAPKTLAPTLHNLAPHASPAALLEP